MTVTKRFIETAARRQRGAVLIVSLVVLLVITLLGVAGMNSSLMQERMAANAQNVNRTFQAAESSVGVLTNILMGGNLSLLQQAMGTENQMSDAVTYSIGGADIASTYQARYLGEIIVSSGSSMDASESTTLLKGYRFELSGASTINATGASTTIFKGIEYY
ncbi:PilX N-terminal domain-containing pilus assembly protein [Marinobacter zhejiangensis]|uniref:Type IV pilus assembly protein PilX n=1 Tax=Marinobacter zhejiangensis TaxID=488535 RepID=A0A1I4S839_9GAMM|nr:PilX N-terminal domain-containing pilus assembly protein [Marinobacter zhejiangensis]SFM60450.1 type IV pilus assembly protein PilX [Marinobacter zhejiangensis]